MKELNEPGNTDVFPNVVSLRRNVNLEYVFTTTCAMSLRGFVVASVVATLLAFDHCFDLVPRSLFYAFTVSS